MQAVRVQEPGGPEQLAIANYPTPEPGPDEVLVRVAATALNRADVLQRKGAYPPPPGASELLGLEVAGTIVAMGTACEGWHEGDRVFGLLPGGGYAEYAVIDHRLAMPMPDGLSFEEAAAIPEVFLTAFQALHGLGKVKDGSHVLIHAGASGVGTAAIQLAKAAGAFVYVTASAPKHDACLALGADLAIDYRNEDFAARIQDATEGRGVDLIVDFIGAPYLDPNVTALALDGRIVLLAMMGGSRVEAFNLARLFRKRGRLITSTLRNRSLDYKIRLTRDFAERYLPLFADGRLHPVIDSVYNWTDVQDAHRRMEANENVGKIVLRVTPSNDLGH